MDLGPAQRSSVGLVHFNAHDWTRSTLFDRLQPISLPGNEGQLACEVEGVLPPSFSTRFLAWHAASRDRNHDGASVA